MNDVSRQRTVLKTLVISDIVESTKITETLGDERAAEVLARHDAIVRGLLQQFHGEEISVSDGFLVSFERPIESVQYALALHDALAQLSREAGISLAVRVGIHFGEVVLVSAEADSERPEYKGLAIPSAARIMALAVGWPRLWGKRGSFLG